MGGLWCHAVLAPGQAPASPQVTLQTVTFSLLLATVKSGDASAAQAVEVNYLHYALLALQLNGSSAQDQDFKSCMSAVQPPGLHPIYACSLHI